jgi:hypothetical protein
VNKGDNFTPRGQISSLGARGEVKNGPQYFQDSLTTGIAIPLVQPGTDVMIFLNIFAEKFSKKIGVLDSKQS